MAKKLPVPHEQQVARYYEANTRMFRWWEGSHREPLAIHRAVDGQTDTAHRRILEAAQGCRAVFDLGCGTGAALWWLASRLEPSVALGGVTLSPSQAAEAARWLGSRGRITTGSYLDPASWPSTASVRLTYAVESLAHNPDPQGFRALLTKQSQHGDRFLLIDDLLARPAESNRETKWLEAFRDGWRVPALESAASWKTDLDRLGWELVADEAWTPRLAVPTRFHLWASSVAVNWSSRQPWKANLAGGAALVLGTRAGLFEYRALEWRRA